ncbi:DUF4236 domain-containing protein [Kallotenue papyrolyticum]|uniref:DUF4236 domain-containing protein n=1 Tax=Kallotenue papyrolyticum TaxID=1325125 RepID=UPI0009DEBBF3
MPLRFNKRFKIAPGVNLNVGKRGIGVSAGVRGFRVSRSRRGTHVTVSAPGTGFSYSRKLGSRRRGCLARLFGR